MKSFIGDEIGYNQQKESQFTIILNKIKNSIPAKSKSSICNYQNHEQNHKPQLQFPNSETPIASNSQIKNPNSQFAIHKKSETLTLSQHFNNHQSIMVFTSNTHNQKKSI